MSFKTSRVLQLATASTVFTHHSLSLAFWNVQHLSKWTKGPRILPLELKILEQGRLANEEKGRVAMNNWLNIKLKKKNITCPNISPISPPSPVDSDLSCRSAPTHCLADELWKTAAPSSSLPRSFLAFLCTACNQRWSFFGDALAQMALCRKELCCSVCCMQPLRKSSLPSSFKWLLLLQSL